MLTQLKILGASGPTLFEKHYYYNIKYNIIRQLKKRNSVAAHFALVINISPLFNNIAYLSQDHAMGVQQQTS